MGERYVAVSYELLNLILREGNEVHVRLRQGLPADAELVRIEATREPDGGCSLVFRSAEWPELPNGASEAVVVVLQQLDCQLSIGPATAQWARTQLRELADAAAAAGGPSDVDADELALLLRYLGTKAAAGIEGTALEPKARTSEED